jgi:chemosensory pili system protein ChpA (sensor histidine kinase/response regulator)
MSEVFPAFDDDNLSSEDLEILQAFEEKNEWSATSTADEPRSAPAVPVLPQVELADEAAQDWLAVFLTEADEDIAKMRRVLSQLELETPPQPAHFVPLQRLAHKIRGAAGAIDCHGIAAITQHVEATAEEVAHGQVVPARALPVLRQALTVMEAALQQLASSGHEGLLPLQELVSDFQNVPGQAAARAKPSADVGAAPTMERGQDTPTSGPAHIPNTPFMPFIRVDGRRVSQVIHYSEQALESRAPLVIAQENFETAMQDLRTAQLRLRQLQSQLSTLFADGQSLAHTLEELPSSSLASRVLQASRQAHQGRPLGDGYGGQQANYLPSDSDKQLTRSAFSGFNDKLDIESYTEKDMLVRSLTEAMNDVTTATERVDAAFKALSIREQESMARGTALRNAVFLLRLVPLKTLVSRLQRAVSTSALPIEFEVRGEETEVDQSILDALAHPLSQMLRTCLADTSFVPEGVTAPRIWLHAQSMGNEVALEIGFSIPVNGGALEAIRTPMLRLNGTYTLRRNNAGGISFLLRLPRSHGTTQCLTVRVGSQQLLVPFSQVLSIEELRPDAVRPDLLYHLADLLNFPRAAGPSPRVRPLLLLALDASVRLHVGVLVDEVLGETEPVVKPLPCYLQRPGLTGVAIDGHGKALLMLDLPELMRLYRQQQPMRSIQHVSHPHPTTTASTLLNGAHAEAHRILVADDSVSLRRSISQTLRHAHYAVTEARDGMEALELLLGNPPEVCLLDIEMPNLNGFDLLSILNRHPDLAHVKIAMLTSRSSEKHMRRARELGAHAYLIKPCAQTTLLETVQSLLRLL